MSYVTSWLSGNWEKAEEELKEKRARDDKAREYAHLERMARLQNTRVVTSEPDEEIVPRKMGYSVLNTNPGSSLGPSTNPGSSYPGSSLAPSSYPGSSLPESSDPGSSLPRSSLPSPTVVPSSLPGYRLGRY